MFPGGKHIGRSPGTRRRKNFGRGMPHGRRKTFPGGKRIKRSRGTRGRKGFESGAPRERRKDFGRRKVISGKEDFECRKRIASP